MQKKDAESSSSLSSSSTATTTQQQNHHPRYIVVTFDMDLNDAVEGVFSPMLGDMLPAHRQDSDSSSNSGSNSGSGLSSGLVLDDNVLRLLKKNGWWWMSREFWGYEEYTVRDLRRYVRERYSWAAGLR